MNGLKPEDAAAFIMAINQIQPYVPPMIFNNIANSPIAAALSMYANRRTDIEFKPVENAPVPAPPQMQ